MPKIVMQKKGKMENPQLFLPFLRDTYLGTYYVGT